MSWFRSPANVVAGGLVVLGGALTALDWGWLALVAAGTFGPGLLRELGWLHDKDECEMRAARRAGYHAYLVGGLLVFLLVAAYRSHAPTAVDPAELTTAILAVMWFTWLLSSLLSYWGALQTVRRILYVFGGVWLLFNILSGEGNWRVGFMQSLLAVPFFALALVAGRRPRLAGVLLLAAAAFFFWLFGMVEIFTRPLGMGRIVVLVLFLGPLVASGVALLGGRAPNDLDDEDGLAG